MTDAVVIERILGLFYGVLGWAIIMNPRYWYETIQDMRKNLSIDFVVGLIALMIGSVIVTVHNIWEPTPTLITTVMGWAALLKGFIFLTIPRYVFQITDRFYQSPKAIKLAGFFALILALIILYYSYNP